MAVNLSPVGGVAAQFFTNTGAVLTGGKLYTYAAGTTTPAVTYTSSQGNVPWSNPIVLDAAGRVSGSGEIWLTDGINYKFVLKDSTDVLIATYDNISGINSNFVAYTNSQEIQTATAGQTVFTLTTMQYQAGTNSLSVFVDGVNQYGPGAQYSYVETSSTVVTFNSGLHVGAEVKFTSTQQQGAGAIDSSQVSYDPPFTGSVATNVEAKLAQTVSVMDFGATGDGVTDDTAAIQAAAAALGTSPGTVFFPAGTYVVTGKVSCYSGQNFISEGAALDVSAYDGVFLSYNEADTFDFLNYYPPTTISGFKVLGKVSTVSPNINFVFVKINRTPYVNVSNCTLYYAGCAWVLGESILCKFDSVICLNPISSSYSFVLGTGGFGPNGCTLTNCQIEEQKYPCTGVYIASGGINIDNCYMESLSTLVHLNGGNAFITNTAMGLRWQVGSTAVLVDQPATLRLDNCSITFGGSATTPIDQIVLNINAATALTFVNNEVLCTSTNVDTATCFSLKTLVTGVIDGNQFKRNSNGTNLDLFSCGAGAIQMFYGKFSDNFVSADFGSTITFNKNTGTGSYISASSSDNFYLRVVGFQQITGSTFSNDQYTASSLPPLPTVASASSISIASPATVVSGAVAISTIASTFNQITLIPSGLWATNTAGNIALGSTAVVGKALILTYDATTSKWYPSY